MDDQQLQAWVEQISLRDFGRPFQHMASFNSRLRSTGGRYFTQNHNIEISRMQYETHGTDEVEKIIKHELCHYHLHRMNKGYRHRDNDFRVLLKTVGGSRFCQAVTTGKRRIEQHKYRLICLNCRTEYWRKRKVDTKKYGCGVCKGRLKLIEQITVDP